MNEELKALVSLIISCIKVEQDIEGKKFFLFMIPDLFAAASQVPDVIQNWRNLRFEVKALSEMSNQHDLLTYIQSKFKSEISDQKANDLLAAILQFIEHLAGDVVGIQKALNE